jgi:pre-mRNA-splicing factor CWC22
MGMDTLCKKLKEESLQPFLEGVFPRDSVKNARFSINFFISIGLGRVTDDLTQFLKNAP